MYPTFSWEGVPWNHHFQSNSSSVCNDFFSKTTHRVFMKFGMKLWCFKGKKWQNSIFLEKNHILEEKSKNISRIGWFGVLKMFNPLICAFFGFTWNIIIAFMILRKLYVLEKSGYMQRCPCPIRLYDFLNLNIPKVFWNMKSFFAFN